jgi:hypothetical protein
MPAKPPKPIDEAVVRAWVELTRAEQGLPTTITDPRIIERVAAILRLSREEARRRATQEHNREEHGRDDEQVTSR